MISPPRDGSDAAADIEVIAGIVVPFGNQGGVDAETEVGDADGSGKFCGCGPRWGTASFIPVAAAASIFALAARVK